MHDLLIESSFTLSVAESCSSGLIASELTSIAVVPLILQVELLLIMMK